MGSEQSQSRHRFGLALEFQRLDRFRLDGAASERNRSFPEQHLARRRRLLEAGGHIDGIPGREALLGARDDLSGANPDTAFDPELREALPHLERRAAGTERVVLVRARDAEDGHHCIADEFLHR
ncbi:MAG: hypothetical protein M3O77_04295, partial [Chloroflexota bacterium]|nr:hypothetical protein [Chloroflexota bacterium]